METLTVACSTSGCENEAVEITVTAAAGSEVLCGPCGTMLVAVVPGVVVVTWAEVRAERDRLLAASDWTQVADAPVDASAWAVYRQALRDVPQDFATPDAVVWPAPPA